MNKTDLDLSTLDERVQDLEARAGQTPFPRLLDEAVRLTADLLRHYARVGREREIEGETLLDLLRAFLKGDPSLNAVRDNVRELIYYQNCLAQGREDALPAQPERMAARTVAHIHLYLRVRLEQMGRA